MRPVHKKSSNRWTSISGLLDHVNIVTQNASASFDNLFYAVHTTLVNSVRRKGNKVMKPRRVNVRSCTEERASGSRVEAESSAFPIDTLSEKEDDTVDNAEPESPLAVGEASLLKTQNTPSVDPTPQKNDAQDASRSHPLALEQLMAASLQRIQSLEEQVASLKSSVSSPLSSPTRSSIVQNTPVTRDPIEIACVASPKPMINPFMKSLLAEMKTVKLKPIPLPTNN